MEIEIRFDGKVNQETSNHLNGLSNAISNSCDVIPDEIRETIEHGQKDSGLILGLTIAGLALSAMDTLINVLTYWQSQQTKYSVEFSIEGKTYTLESSSLKGLHKALSSAEKEFTPKVQILIGKK